MSAAAPSTLNADRFSGKTAVVTGGTRGIGRAIAVGLAQQGARVVITGTDMSRTQAAAREISSEGGRPVEGIVCQVADESQVVALAAHVGRKYERVDVLVNNAAIARRNPILDISLDEWNEVYGVNVTGTFLTVRELLPLMTGPAPAIINIASQAGKRGEALLIHYASSKAAQIGLTKSLALELAPRIRVNAICPGFIETDMILEHYQVQARLRGVEPEQVRGEMVAKIPLGRMQSASSVADVALFLASDSARDMTGQAINVTGGMVMD